MEAAASVPGKHVELFRKLQAGLGFKGIYGAYRFLVELEYGS